MINFHLATILACNPRGCLLQSNPQRIQIQPRVITSRRNSWEKLILSWSLTGAKIARALEFSQLLWKSPKSAYLNSHSIFLIDVWADRTRLGRPSATWADRFNFNARPQDFARNRARQKRSSAIEWLFAPAGPCAERTFNCSWSDSPVMWSFLFANWRSEYDCCRTINI
jgi:hypothetical protein